MLGRAGVTYHVCHKMMSSTFKPIKTEEKVFMGEFCHFKNQRLRKSGLEDDIWEGINSN